MEGDNTSHHDNKAVSTSRVSNYEIDAPFARLPEHIMKKNSLLLSTSSLIVSKSALFFANPNHVERFLKRISININ